jgi:hypothetical protein
MRVFRGQPNTYEDSIFITTEKQKDYYVIRQGMKVNNKLVNNEIIIKTELARTIFLRMLKYIQKQEQKDKETIINRIKRMIRK